VRGLDKTTSTAPSMRRVEKRPLEVLLRARPYGHDTEVSVVGHAGTDEVRVRESANHVVTVAVATAVLPVGDEQLARNHLRGVGPKPQGAVRILRSGVVIAGAGEQPSCADARVDEIHAGACVGLADQSMWCGPISV